MSSLHGDRTCSTGAAIPTARTPFDNPPTLTIPPLPPQQVNSSLTLSSLLEYYKTLASHIDDINSYISALTEIAFPTRLFPKSEGSMSRADAMRKLDECIGHMASVREEVGRIERNLGEIRGCGEFGGDNLVGSNVL